MTITIPQDQLAEFCQRWKIRELALFGSALRDDFTPDSDIDMLVTFAAEADWSLLDHVRMQQELERRFQREVDFVSKTALERSTNWLRRAEILNTARVIFAERETTDVTR